MFLSGLMGSMYVQVVKSGLFGSVRRMGVGMWVVGVVLLLGSILDCVVGYICLYHVMSYVSVVVLVNLLSVAVFGG